MTLGRILIVEDEALIRLFVLDALGDYGFQVEEAENATDAMAQLSANDASVDAVIIDIGLPDRRGDLLTTELRKKWADLPIVIATGHDRTELASRFSLDARIAVIGKPYSPGMLLEALRKVGVETRDTSGSD